MKSPLFRGYQGFSFREVKVTHDAPLTVRLRQTLALPSFDMAPAISGSPWAGGTVTSVDGTPSGHVSDTKDWEIDTVSQGVAATTFNPAAVDIGGSLERVQTATNGAGTTEVRSNALVIEKVRGITRARDTAPLVRTAVGAITAYNALIVEWVGLGGSGNHVIGSLVRTALDPNRKGFGILWNDGSNLLEPVFYYGPNAPDIGAAISVPTAFDGTTRHMAMLVVYATSYDFYYIVPGGAVTGVSGSISGGVDTGSGVGLFGWANGVGASGPLARCQATLSAVAINGGISPATRLTAADAAALAAAGSIEAWGGHTHPDKLASVDCATLSTAGANITTAADLLEGALETTGFTVSTNLTAGTLNTPV